MPILYKGISWDISDCLLAVRFPRGISRIILHDSHSKLVLLLIRETILITNALDREVVGKVLTPKLITNTTYLYSPF